MLGVVDADTEVPILAPEHFLEHAVSENVYAGTAMLRRGYYYGGVALPKGAKGTLGMGLGPAASTGTVGLIAPTIDITRTGQEEVLDGVRIVFQNTPGTECPSEMNFYFPDHKALCLAENATHNLHNLLTLRGAQVRDPRIWRVYLAEAMELFARRSDVAFASHHWPTWGADNITTYLAEQRDLYAYLHDQTLRLINQGYVGSEIAEMLEMPPGLDEAWHTHGYYGSANHNVKAIYQRYLGWYDGNPAHLWQHPPVAAAERYVKVIGGVDATVAKAIDFLEKGDLRFAAELANHAVFAAPDSETARQVLRTALTELGYGAECATWRNCFLMGARELFHEIEHTDISSAGMAPPLTVTQLFDSIAIRINGPKAWNEHLRINWTVRGDGAGGSGSGSGSGEYRMELSNGALIHFPTTVHEEADLTVTLTKTQLIGLLLQGQTDGVEMSGDPGVLATLVGLLDTPDPDFAVVTP